MERLSKKRIGEFHRSQLRSGCVCKDNWLLMIRILRRLETKLDSLRFSFVVLVQKPQLSE